MYYYLFLTLIGCVKQQNLSVIQKRELDELIVWKQDRKGSSCVDIVDRYYNDCISCANDFYILRIKENAHFMCVGNRSMGNIYENGKRIPQDIERQKLFNIKLACKDVDAKHKLHIRKLEN